MTKDTKDAHHLYDFNKPIRPMTCKYRPFSATRPPPEDDIDALIEWGNKIIRRNQEFIERERRLHDETRDDPNPYL